MDEAVEGVAGQAEGKGAQGEAAENLYLDLCWEGEEQSAEFRESSRCVRTSPYGLR